MKFGRNIFWRILVTTLTLLTALTPLSLGDVISKAANDTEYAVNVGNFLNGLITPSVSQAAQGTTITLTAIPDASYGLVPGTLKVTTDSQNAPRFIRGEGTAENPYTFIMPDDSVTVTAVFLRYHTISIDAGIANGTLITDIFEAIKDEVVTVTVIPDPGYRLKFNSTLNNANKSLDFTDKTIYYEIADKGGTPYARQPIFIPDYGSVIGSNSLNLNIEATTYYFFMPNADVTITAEFVPAYQIEIDGSVTGGSFNLYGRTEASAVEYVSFANVADPGWTHVNGSTRVIDNTTGTDAIGIDADGKPIGYNPNYGFIMPASNVTLFAEFEVLPPIEGVLVVTPDDAEATMTWTPEASFSGYGYYRKAGTTGETYIGWLNLGAGTTGTLKATGLTNGIEYEFWLSANGQLTGSVFATPIGFPPESITLHTHSVDTIPGGEVVLYVELDPISSKSKITWSSSDESVASVQQNGRINARAEGTVVITATEANGGLSDNCVVNVLPLVSSSPVGSMIIGTVNAEYDETGGRVQLPFTVTVPTNKPIYRGTFAFTTSTTLVYKIVGISLNGTTIDANRSTVIDDISVRVGALPYPTSISSTWATITPATGKFLTPGKVYEFVLEVEILPTAAPIISVGYSNMTNYTGFYYYDPDYDNRQQGDRTTGTINAMWVGNSAEPSTSGSGTNTVYNLFTADDLLWYANKWNNDSSFNYSAAIYADIDLTGRAFDGIGTETHPFSRNITGNGHTVTYNLAQDDDDDAVGFVRYMSAGTISGLKTEGEIIVTGNNVKAGGLVGEMTGTAYFGNGCVNNVNIEVSGTGGWVGGLTGYMNNTATTGYNTAFGSAVNNGTILAPNADYVGGIAGYVKCIQLEVNEITNNGAVTGSGYVGGIVGYLEYANSPRRFGTNANYGTITSMGGEATGGIAGAVANAHVGQNWASPTRGDNWGPFGNSNFGDVIGASKYVGGIVGYVDNTGSQFIWVNGNEGNVVSTYDSVNGAVGGVIGYLSGGMETTIGGNINKGDIAAEADTVMGGVIGSVLNALNDSKISNNYYAEQDGLLDAIDSASAPKNFLSLDRGWAPNYSGSPDDDGSIDKPYKLANAFDILWFASEINSGAGNDGRPIRRAYVELVADIDLTGYPSFEGIGVYGIIGQPAFNGTFDGKGFTITLALDASTSTRDNAALFHQANGATIKNLVIKGSVKSKSDRGSAAGLVLNISGGTIENVTNYADITAFNNAAGITTGDYNGPDALKNLANYGTIIGGNAAGIVTMLGGQCVINNCVNNGDVTATGIAAGVVGMINGGSKSNSGAPSYFITNCVNNGTITSRSAVAKDVYPNRPSTSNTAGGIIGRISGAIVDIRRCTNNGLVQSTGNSAGGIVGSGMGEWNIGAGETSQMTDIRITNTENNGDVKSLYNGDDPSFLERIGIGGIIGQTGEYDWTTGNPGGTQGLELTGNVNNGIISGPEGANVGTIVGITDTGSNSSGGTVTIENNWSSTEAIGGGKTWADPRYKAPETGLYNPNTQEIINGQLVNKTPPATSTTPVSSTTPTTTSPSSATPTKTSSPLTAPTVIPLPPPTAPSTTPPLSVPPATLPPPPPQTTTLLPPSSTIPVTVVPPTNTTEPFDTIEPPVTTPQTNTPPPEDNLDVNQDNPKAMSQITLTIVAIGLIAAVVVVAGAMVIRGARKK